jgi:hypothetical protein
MQKTIFLIPSLLLVSLTVCHAQFVEEPVEGSGNYAEQSRFIDQTADVVSVFLSILFITSLMGFIVAGIKFIVAGGGEDVLQSARRISLASLIGLVLSLVGYIIISLLKHLT